MMGNSWYWYLKYPILYKVEIGDADDIGPKLTRPMKCLTPTVDKTGECGIV